MSIEKVNFHVYADGKKRILVVDNCVGETLTAFNKILEEVCNLPASEAAAVPALAEGDVMNAPKISSAPVQSFGFKAPKGTAKSTVKKGLHFPDIILLSGEYAGMTPSEAVAQDGIRAVPIICEYSKEVEPDTARKQVVECCKHLIAEDLASRPSELRNGEELTEFFTIYRQLLGTKCLREIQSSLGVDVDSAISNADTESLSKAYHSVISDLRDRTKV